MDESLESEESISHIVQNNNPELTARVCVSFSMKRNLGNYEDCHFSIRYEQSCKPEDRAAMTELLEKEASDFIAKRYKKVDEFILARKREDEAKSQGQTQYRSS